MVLFPLTVLLDQSLLPECKCRRRVSADRAAGQSYGAKIRENPAAFGPGSSGAVSAHCAAGQGDTPKYA